MVSRRRFLGGMALASLSVSSVAEASVARAMTVGELVYRSRYVVVGTSADAFCRWEKIGARSRIVTYRVLRVERPLDGRPPDTSELMVRTLGGSVGDLGQIVHGEAVITLGAKMALFLHDVHDTASDVLAVTGMAQGCYPVERDPQGIERLRSAVSDLELRDVPGAAVRRLHGSSMAEAEALLAEELARGAR
jgi:hypothetical protein